MICVIESFKQCAEEAPLHDIMASKVLFEKNKLAIGDCYLQWYKLILTDLLVMYGIHELAPIFDTVNDFINTFSYSSVDKNNSFLWIQVSRLDPL